MQRNKIYKSTKWKKVREQVLRLDHYECQRCNNNFFDSGDKKKVIKATLVHHVYLAEDYPEYKYSIYVNGKRNLVSLCFDCHEIIHGRKRLTTEEKFSTEERYD